MNKAHHAAYTLLIIFLIVVQGAYSQHLPNKDATLYNIIDRTDSIQFVRFSVDSLRPRPTILYCQGSLPYPLFTTQGDQSWMIPMDVFDYKTIIKKYNLIIISMPHTPVVVKSSQLNHNSEYVPDINQPETFDARYIEDNYLEKYVERGNIVLEFLKNQQWVDPEHIILLGHSQGAHVAAHLAQDNPDIYALGYFSGNPLGRYAQFIREKRIASNSGLISADKAQSGINQLYAKWKDVCAHYESGNTNNTDRSWISFSRPYIDKIVRLEMPIFITYGTEDPGAQMCDLLPIYFELNKKTNYGICPFIGCGHNFEVINSDGTHNYDIMHWQEAIDAFLLWLDNVPCAS